MHRFFLRFFLLTIVVVQNVGPRDPKGVPLGARMRNRISPFFRMFSDMLCSTPRPRSHCVVFLRVHLIL
jgi:hypothetical protein